MDKKKPNVGNHQTTHFVQCLTEDGTQLEFIEDDAQIVILGSYAGATTQVEVCIDTQNAYALGLWLIISATMIHSRYPEMVGIPAINGEEVHG
jgi:hypothetical protein